MPPCRSIFRKHIQRPNYVESLWKKANHPLISVGNASDHGWKNDFSPDWIGEPYREDIAESPIESDDTQESAVHLEDTNAEYFSDTADEGEF